jgi:hypothetical protein
MPRNPLPLSRRPARSTLLPQSPRLESIGENGPLEKVLNRDVVGASAEVESLMRALQCELESIRNRAAWITKEMSASYPREFLFEDLKSGLSGDPIYESRQTRDPVLICAIARIEGLEEPFEELFDEAFERFRCRPFAYRDAFGALLPKEFADIAKRIDYSKGRNATAADDFPAFRERLDSQRALVANRGLLGMPTGLPKLDEALCGFRGITFLCAPKGAGKTTLMLSAALATLRRCDDVAVLILSFDESKDRIYQRLLCLEAGISYRQLQNPDPEAQGRLDQAEQRLLPLLARMRIVERRIRYPAREEHSEEVLKHQGYDLKALREDLDSLESATDTDNLLLCVDLFQKWPSPDDVAIGADEDRFRLDVLDRLRRESFSLERPDGFSMLVLSEVRKDAPGELEINDLKGDGRMTSDADCVLLMYPASDRPDPKAKSVPMTIQIAKGRDGVDRVDVPVWFDFRHYRFFDHDPNHGGEEPSASSEANGAHANGRRTSRQRGPTSGSSDLDPLAK